MAFGVNFELERKENIELYLKILNNFIVQIKREKELNTTELQAFQTIGEYYTIKLKEVTELGEVSQVLNDYLISKCDQLIKEVEKIPTNRRPKKTNELRGKGKDGKDK